VSASVAVLSLGFAATLEAAAETADELAAEAEPCAELARLEMGAITRLELALLTAPLDAEEELNARLEDDFDEA
jgi:hypothetical protein